MEKKAVLLLLCLAALAMLAPFNAFSQDTIRIKSSSNPFFEFATDLADSIQNSPTPSAWLPTNLQSKASWRYFWMLDNSWFGWDSTMAFRYTTNETNNVAVKVRGRYSDTKEPPAMRQQATSSGVPNPDVYPDSLDRILNDKIGEQIGLFPNWNAMRPADTLYLALPVRNYTADDRSGYLKLLFPRAEFQYFGEVFPNKSIHFGNISQEDVYDGSGILAGNLCTWRIENLPRSTTQTLFIEIVATGAAQDSTTHLFQADVVWDDEIPPSGSTSAASLFKLGKDQSSGSQTLNPVIFDQEAVQPINISRARDPNSLTVTPKALPPAVSAPSHTLRYRVDVENIGSAMVRNVRVVVYFDDRIDLRSDPSSIFDFQFPNMTFTHTIDVGGDSAVFNLRNVNLQGGKYASGKYCKGHFYFNVVTKANIPLPEGDQIRAQAIVSFVNTITEDSVHTAPAIVHIQEPKGNAYGCLLGVKYFTNLPNPDSIKNNGLALTMMVPLYRPRGNTLQSKYLKAPKLFWQFELGIGAATFNGPGDSSRVQTNYVHLSPAQLRYTGGVLPGGITKFGLSAGYSVNYVYKAEENSQKVAFQSGLGRRLEHELFATADLFNLSGVPGITIGAGYKYRWNKIFADRISYHCPFVYAQLNFALLRKNSIQLWDKVYRW